MSYSRASKAGSVTARDIQTSSGVSVLDPGHHILTLQEDRELNVELYVNKGRGFVLADQHPVPEQVDQRKDGLLGKIAFADQDDIPVDYFMVKLPDTADTEYIHFFIRPDIPCANAHLGQLAASQSGQCSDARCRS